jgi:uncharacterized protein
MPEVGYFPIKDVIALDHFRVDRIMYGSDFPSIPYHWDRELKVLKASNLSRENMEWIPNKSAADLFQIA